MTPDNVSVLHEWSDKHRVGHVASALSRSDQRSGNHHGSLPTATPSAASTTEPDMPSPGDKRRPTTSSAPAPQAAW